ncbi:MmcQ/YjbR family DNA-binding protein [Salinispora arenicola]|uniref:MmcQ/YjbR family DNA-binding protein n=1 Tax=Salinispora arenicola TaxID=168697 RepID=UPI000365968C|nr:MmcQ/YjbR family DNA-binding protein [Salinispora arenicola]MCN0151140.1 MmcQ/YjbR family DNA-binding protein [Salinispora arenicola]
MVTVADIRTRALALPRSYEALVRDRVTFRVGRIVYLSIAPDETTMGFAHPKEERNALIIARPTTFFMPSPSDERYNWAQVRLAALDAEELDELVLDAWCMAVPRGVAAAELSRRGLVVPDRPPRVPTDGLTTSSRVARRADVR